MSRDDWDTSTDDNMTGAEWNEAHGPNAVREATSNTARKPFTVYDNEGYEVEQFDNLNDARPKAKTNNGFVVAGAIVYDSRDEED
jgi:hypothetical protein